MLRDDAVQLLGRVKSLPLVGPELHADQLCKYQSRYAHVAKSLKAAVSAIACIASKGYPMTLQDAPAVHPDFAGEMLAFERI